MVLVVLVVVVGVLGVIGVVVIGVVVTVVGFFGVVDSFIHRLLEAAKRSCQYAPVQAQIQC